ncbi:MAG: nucleotidyltransferase family protein [Desulfobacterales bacterium]
MTKHPTAGIILAAGMSTRLGRPKQLIKTGGEYLLWRVIHTALASDLERIVLVLGYKAEMIVEALEQKLEHSKLRLVINQRFRDGMSTSLQSGLRAVENQFSSIMVLLGDMPLVDADTINNLLQRFWASDKSICAPIFLGKRGHPVCFDKKIYPLIMGISGDIGARDIIKRNISDVLFIEVENSEVFLDVDNESDVTDLMKNLRY